MLMAAVRVVVNSGCLNERIVGDFPGSLRVISVPVRVRVPLALSSR